MIRKLLMAALGAVLGLALVVATHGAASDPPAKSPQKSAAAPKPAAASSPASTGMRVFIDPATGKIRDPEPGEAEALAPAARTTLRTVAPATIQGPNGAVGMRLDDSYMNYSVATKNPDGTVSFDCVKGSDAAKQKVAGKDERRPSNEK